LGLLNTYIAFQKSLNIQKTKSLIFFFFLAWARPISPGRKYPLAWAKIYRLGESSPESKVYFRLSENTLAWARIPPRLGEKFVAWAKAVQRAYLLLETILAWARLCRLGELCRKLTVFTISELPCMPQMTKLVENQATYTMNDLP